MEEKERYEYQCDDYDCTESYIYDNATDCEYSYLESICNLLNQQDKEKQQLKQQLAESEKKIASIQALLSENAIDRKAMQEFKIGEDEYDLTDEDARNSLCWEVEELKQQLHDLPKKIVEDIEKNFTEYLPLKYKTGAGFYSRLNTILKKYGGENE